MSSVSIINTNDAIRKFRELSDIMSNLDFQEKLKELNVLWATGTINQGSELIPVFAKQGYVVANEGQYQLTRAGILFYSRLCIDFEYALSLSKSIDEKYEIINTIRVGKNSATFLAKHVKLSRKVVLKFIRPGASIDIITSLQKISDLTDMPHLVQPIDFFNVPVKDVFGKDILVECIAFPYADGPSLRTFLGQKNKPLGTYFLVSYIKQIGEVLALLENIGAYHGDLHEDNVIVNQSSSGRLEFKVIDVSFGLTGSGNSEICRDTDLSCFRHHIWRILSVQQEYLSKMSIKKYLGAEIYFLVSTILSSAKINFAQVISLLKHNHEYDQYLEEKDKFISSKFSAPAPFKLLRFEEITDHQLARELFWPFPSLINNIKSFSNVFVSGNRGSGKSTYLASIAFFPKVSGPIVSHKDTFGIYFPCRQGEFRLLSSEMINYSKVSPGRVKHVIILKIIRRTLEILSEAIDARKISIPIDYTTIRERLASLLRDDNMFSIDTSIVSEIKNMLSIVIRIEMKELENLFGSQNGINEAILLSERDLITFFETIRLAFSEISNTKFHILFDDAGEPNIPIEAQRIINDLIFSSNSIYCVKFSAERNTYNFQTSTEKQLEEGHDYFEYDISRVLFIGTKGVGLSHAVLETYFHEIIKRRLEHFEYQSSDIIDYLGNDLVKHHQLINSLSTGRRNAMYCGWSMIWKIADRTPRNLLDIVCEIFAGGNVDNNSAPAIIPNRIQNRALRLISEKRLRSLAQISGTLNTSVGKINVGERIYDIARSIGSVFNIYLKVERGKKNKRQYLAVERNDSSPLSIEAEMILKKLVTYGVLDESKLEFSRDDEIKKSIYVFNRIYCPAFGISMQRDEHLRLSKNKFEELLLKPIIFVRDGTRLLRHFDPNPQLIDLFEGL